MHRRKCTSVLAVVLTLVNGLLPTLSGCDILGGLPAGVTAEIQINTDPNDPMLGKLIGGMNSGTLVFYGQKNAGGLTKKVEMMQYFPPGATMPYTYQFDDDVRPVFITGPNGEVATLTYEGDSVSVTFKDANGKVSVESFDLGKETGSRLREQVQSAYKGLADLSDKLAAAQMKTTVKAIQGSVVVYLRGDDANSGVVKDANLVVTATGTEGVIPVACSGLGYNFTVAHRVADLSVPISECEKITADTGTAFTAAGVVLAVMAAACIGVTSGFCAFLIGPGGAFLGIGIGGTSLLAAGANYKCKDLIMSQAIASGQGRQTVTITATHPTMKFKSTVTVQYDLFNSADPITADAAFLKTIWVDVDAAILNVFTIPAAPAAGQSYRIVFEFAPPTASIRYSVSGSDGYSFSETLTGDGTRTTVNGSSIPGGARGVSDTIVADILMNGAKAGSSTPISITFH